MASTAQMEEPPLPPLFFGPAFTPKKVELGATESTDCPLVYLISVPKWYMDPPEDAVSVKDMLRRRIPGAEPFPIRG